MEHFKIIRVSLKVHRALKIGAAKEGFNSIDDWLDNLLFPSENRARSGK